MQTERERVAYLIKCVLLDKMSVASACASFPKNSRDINIDTAFYALAHREADEDYRRRSSQYATEQDNYLLSISEILGKNEALPVNIINEYRKYYDHAPIYPNVDFKYIISELKKFINCT